MVDLNYFPAFSTPQIPEGIEGNLPPGLSGIPEYWHTLSEPVDPAKGIPHFRDVIFENIQAVDVETAMSMSGYGSAPLENFTFKNVSIQAQHAGRMQYVQGLTLQNVSIQARDGKPIAITGTFQTKGSIRQSR